MPNCFQLMRKTDPKTPVSFIKIDEEICAHFKIKPDEHKYYLDWYDIVGWKIAVNGMKLNEIVDKIKEEIEKTQDEYAKKLLAVVEYFNEHYTSNAWFQIGNNYETYN